MDRLTEMEAFATVVDQGGFTDAAKKMGISKSAVSKHVSALEARLGARLLNRTTRRVSPTEIGLAYYDRARRVLNDAGEADALVTSMQSAPSGLLRMSVATDFGVNLLSPILGEFLLEYPDITVNMVLNNRYVELISEGFDMAIRLGELEDSTMRARKLTETTKRMIGSPAISRSSAGPQKIDDLNDHKLLHYSNQANGQCLEGDRALGRKAAGAHGGLADGERRPVAAERRDLGPWASPICPASSLPMPCGQGWSKRRSPACRSRRWASMPSIRRALHPAQGARLHRLPRLGRPLGRPFLLVTVRREEPPRPAGSRPGPRGSGSRRRGRGSPRPPRGCGRGRRRSCR
jgi:DNA-binding transcriptional LysR family regulator